MRILIIGQNSKIADVFCRFASVIMVVDKNIESYRQYNENSKFLVIESMTDIRNARSIPQRTKELKCWIKKYVPDIIFTNDKYSMIAARFVTMFMPRRPKLISTSHSSYSWSNPRQVYLFTLVVRWCTDGYIALASFVYRYLINNGFNSKRLLLQPNTIEYNTFSVKQSYELNKIPQLIYTAVIYPQKGQLTLIEAVRLLAEKQIVLHVDLIGDFVDEKYKNQIEEYIKRFSLSEYITFKGRVENTVLRKILSTYDIYISPSYLEMSPFNLLEAKAVGLPIIACKTGGIPYIISDTNDGILVPPKDANSLANAIELLLNNNEMRRQLGNTARYNISTVQAPETVANQINNFFSQIISL